MRFGLMSDIHLSKKPYRLVSALRLLQDVELLLIAGDLTDNGKPEEFELVEQTLDTHFPDKPILIVSGNHDIPQNQDAPYRRFEQKINQRLTNRYAVEQHASGAYYVSLTDAVDFIGLNPLYHQKLFRFSNKGEQLAFAERKLADSTCKTHILLCHPPLIAHNPQRDADEQPYLPKEQDTRLQALVDAHDNVLFFSGHTHVFPEIEQDSLHGHVYINDGSLCPTQKAGGDNQTYQGNVIRFELDKQLTNLQVLHLSAGSGKTDASVFNAKGLQETT